MQSIYFVSKSFKSTFTKKKNSYIIKSKNKKQKIKNHTEALLIHVSPSIANHQNAYHKFRNNTTKEIAFVKYR